jgi:hypothetical protein
MWKGVVKGEKQKKPAIIMRAPEIGNVRFQAEFLDGEMPVGYKPKQLGSLSAEGMRSGRD